MPVVRYLVRKSSGSQIAFVRPGSGSFDWSFPDTVTGLRDNRSMLDKPIVLDRAVQSLALPGGTCRVI